LGYKNVWFDVHVGNFVNRPELVSKDEGEGKGLSAMCGHRYRTYIELLSSRVLKFPKVVTNEDGLESKFLQLPFPYASLLQGEVF